MRKIICIVIPLCLLLLSACSQPTAIPIPTEEPFPTATPTLRPTEAPKATQAAQETTTGNEALDALIAGNLPAGCYEYGVKYTKSSDSGAQLEIFYPISDFWTLLGMIKAGFTTFYAEAPLLFETDPDLEFVTFIFQKPADSEKAEVGPQPVVTMGVSRENIAKVNSDVRWCDLVTIIDRLEMSPEGASSWIDFCH